MMQSRDMAKAGSETDLKKKLTLRATVRAQEEARKHLKASAPAAAELLPLQKVFEEIVLQRQRQSRMSDASALRLQLPATSSFLQRLKQLCCIAAYDQRCSFRHPVAQYTVLPNRHSVFLKSAGCLSYSLVIASERALRVVGFISSESLQA